MAGACSTTREARAPAGHARYYLEHQGRERTFLLYEPRGMDRQNPRPVLFCLHGGGGTDRGMISLTEGGFNRIADRDTVLVVYPQGVDRGWNDGREGDHSTAARENIDDVDFFRTLIRELQKMYPVDPEQVYACGISNGGFMCGRLACELPGLFRGLALVTATLGRSFAASCRPPEGVDILLINGTDDPLVPWEGGQVKVLGQERGEVLSTAEMIGLWVRNDACDTVPRLEELPDKDPDDGTRVIRHSYFPAREGARVALLEVRGGGHTWPGGRQYLGERLVGKTSRDISACEEIWRFFTAEQVKNRKEGTR